MRFIRTDLLLLTPLLACTIFSLDLAAHPAWGFVVTPTKDILFSDLEHVWRIGADGRIEKLVPNVHTHNLQLDPEGGLYGTDQGYDEPKDEWSMMLWHRSKEGRISDIIPWVTDFQEFGGSNFVVDTAGNVFHDHDARLLKRLRSGRSIEPTSFEFGRISTIAGDDAGNIYVADTVANGSVHLVRPDGSVTTLMTDVVGGEPENSPYDEDRWKKFIGLRVDDGYLYAANWGSRRVIAYDLESGEERGVYRAGARWFPIAYVDVEGLPFILEASSDAGEMRILTDTSEEGGEWFEIYNHATRRVNADYFAAEAQEEPDRARAESRDLWAWIGIGTLVGCSTLGWRMRRRKR